MYDLTNFFLRAAGKTECWSLEKFYRTTDFLEKSLPGSIWNWEIRDLEYWSDYTEHKVQWHLIASEKMTWKLLKKDKETVAYLRVDIPLLIVLEKYVARLENNIDFDELVVIVTSDFFQKSYKIDKDVIKSLFVKYEVQQRPWKLLTKAINTAQFSISELWWLTTIPPLLKIAERDLTDLFLKAAKLKSIWSLGLCLSLLKKIAASMPQTTISYEPGEGWATVISNKDRICKVGVFLPIAFVLEDDIISIENAIALTRCLKLFGVAIAQAIL